MKNELEAIGYIDGQLIEKADNYTCTKKKKTWIKWFAAAACIALVAVLGAVGLNSGLFRTKKDTVSTQSGESIIFVEGNVPAVASDMFMLSRPMDDEEIRILFADLPVTANALFDAETHDIIGLEGTIGNGKLVVSVDGRNLLDTIVSGGENTSSVNGTDVNAGYFVTEANSRGVRTAIYYAAVTIGDNSIYIEFAGDKSESETLKKDLSDNLLKLIENGEFDLRGISFFSAANKSVT